MPINRWIQLAREIVDRVAHEDRPLAAACVVSSLAAGDFTAASDIDILMVAAAGKGSPFVQRRLIEDRVFEWVIVGREDLADIDAILGDAGLAHDILTAIILRDENDWLKRIQEQVASRIAEPTGIWLRVASQIARMRRASEHMAMQIEEGEILTAQRAHVSLLKAVWVLPRAALNKRCTMTRAVLFCREAAEALGWGDYFKNALELFGAANIDAAGVRHLHELAEQVIVASRFPHEEWAIRLRHLEGSRWLLEHGRPADAVWPLYFWSRANIEDAMGESHASLWDVWTRFAAALAVGTEEGLRRKAKLAARFIPLAAELAEKHRHAHGLIREGPV